LSEDAVIRNKDEEKTDPPEAIDGTIFLRPIFSELDTRLQFGNPDSMLWEAVFTPAKYTLSDPLYATEETWPQVPVQLEDVLPEDPSAVRVADEPLEGGEIMSDEEKTAEEVAQEAAQEGEESTEAQTEETEAEEATETAGE
jgi:hypothetical protein